jgi:hypothetical protein
MASTHLLSRANEKDRTVASKQNEIQSRKKRSETGFVDSAGQPTE